MKSLYKHSLAVFRREKVCFCLFDLTVKMKGNSLDCFGQLCTRGVTVAGAACPCGNSPLGPLQCLRTLNSLLPFPRVILNTEIQTSLCSCFGVYIYVYASFNCELLTPQTFKVCASKQSHGADYKDFSSIL